jgi:nucleoprotein TPR
LKEEYKLLNEQFDVVEAKNKALYNQLTNISHQMTTLRDSRNQSGVDDSQLNRSIDTSIPGTDNSEESATTIEQFMDIIKYLRKEKEILAGKIEVVNAECTRIKAQFEATSNQLNESHSALQLANEKINSSMMPSTRFDDLMEKVQTIPALKDSNRVLREENSKFSNTLDQLQSELTQAKNTIDPLKAQLSSQEEVQDRQKSEISALMADNQKMEK